MACVVLTAVSGRREADRLARGLVKAKLAACVTLLPGAVSHYVWKGKTERSREVLLLIKTARKAWPRLSAFIRKEHPYELPELIAFPVLSGSKEYLSWLNGSLK